MTTENCLNCGSPLTGNYCSNCGQKRIDKKDRSLRNFFTYFFNEFFSWDSKFFSSIKYVLFKPGHLTNEYSKGRLADYINPMKLYLCMSLVSFLIMTKVDSDHYTVLMSDNETGENIFANFVDKIRENKGVSEEVFKERFNAQVNDRLPLYLLIMLFVFSIPLKLVDIKKFYVEHLAFSLHFFTFVLFCFLMATILDKLGDFVGYIFTFLLPCIYLLIAFKRFYKQGWILTIFEAGIFSIYYIGLLFFLYILAMLIASVMA